VDGHCVQAAATANGNAYTARMAITRQSSGRRLIAANDPASATEAPGIPALTAKRIGGVVTLSWSEGDTGNSPITGYEVLRGIAPNTEMVLATTLPATQVTYTDPTATDPTKTYYYKVTATNGVGTSCANNEVAAPYVGDICTGLIVQQTPPGHPEQPGGAGLAPASLAIDYIAVGERAGSNHLMMKMKVTNMGATPPPNSRWRMDWNSYAATAYDAAAQQFYVGMSTDANSVVKFEWGTVATAVVGLVVGVPTETERGLLPGSSFNPDGTITLFVPKAKFGNPQPGDLLGAVNGRTFTGDNAQTQNLQRSTLLVDHTFVKAQRDNGHPAATYTVIGNANAGCAAVLPAAALSRKIHAAGTLNIVGDIPLPLIGTPGVECRDGTPAGNHQIVVSFPAPVTFSAAAVTSRAGMVTTTSTTGNQVTINLTGVTDQQKIEVTLFNVNDGAITSEVTIPMIVLAGDTNADMRVNVADTNQTKAASGLTADVSPRTDVDLDGRTNVTDTNFVKAHAGNFVAAGSTAPAAKRQARPMR
jgi:hypothetical protein